MRNWYKYFLVSTNSDYQNIAKKSDSFKDYAEDTGGYEVDDAYFEKKVFFEKHFYNFQLGRLEDCYKFLIKYLQKDQKILSLASGRSALELYLMEKHGSNITCSDLKHPSCYTATKKLFPHYQFIELDALEMNVNDNYDMIITMSFIFLLTDKELDIVFRNMNQSLKVGGYFIVDSAGTFDNLLAYLIHDVLLPLEIYTICFLARIKNFGKRKYICVKRHHGFRRNNDEIEKIAQKNGFELVEVENYAFLTDFYRSKFLSKLLQYTWIKKLFMQLGRKIPYIRMFCFKKIEEQ